MNPENRRYGFVGILVENRDSSPAIQQILTQYSDCILGRMGLPHLAGDSLSIITLIVHATTDQVGALTGRLGALPGVSVKSGMGKF